MERSQRSGPTPLGGRHGYRRLGLTGYRQIRGFPAWCRRFAEWSGVRGAHKRRVVTAMTPPPYPVPYMVVASRPVMKRMLSTF